MSKEDRDKTAATEAKAKADKLVLVEVHHAVAWEGVIVRPLIEGKRGTLAGALKVTPAQAVMPAGLAESFGEDYVTVLGPAPEGASPGLFAEPQRPAPPLGAATAPAKG